MTDAQTPAPAGDEAGTLLLLLVTQRGPTAPAEVKRALMAAGFAVDPASMRAAMRAAGTELVRGADGPLVAIVSEHPPLHTGVEAPDRWGPDPLRRFSPWQLVGALVAVMVVMALFLVVVSPGGGSRPITNYRPPASSGP